jgi:hypothetical protein
LSEFRRDMTKLELSISGSVWFWTKINNQTEFFFNFLNQTESKTSSNQLISVRFGSVWFFPFQTGSNRNYSNLFTVPKKSLRQRSQLKIFLVWAFWCTMPKPPIIKTRPPNPKLLLRTIKKRCHVCWLKLVWTNMFKPSVTQASKR